MAFVCPVDFPIDPIDGGGPPPVLVPLPVSGTTISSTSVVSPPAVGPRIPARTIMVGGYGDAGRCAFLSPNGAISYPQPPSAPNPGEGLSAFARLSTGDIAQVGGNAPTFPTTGAGVWKASDLTRLSEYTGDRANGFDVATDALGYWYVHDLGWNVAIEQGTMRFARLNAASAHVATWEIPMPATYGNNPVVQAIAVSEDGQIIYCWMRKDAIPPATIDNNTYLHKFSLSGAGTWLGLLTTDYNYFGPGYNSLLVVPGSGDLLVAFGRFNSSSGVGALRRYTPSGTLVWTAGTPTGPGPFYWMGLALGLPGDTHFLAWAYTNDTTSSNARYVWFDYATGTPDNTRNFAPDDGAGFEFDSQFVVLAVPIY